MTANRKCPAELRERAVRLYRESDPKPVIAQLGRQLNMHPEALLNWIRPAEADSGERDDRPTTAMVEENRPRIQAQHRALVHPAPGVGRLILAIGSMRNDLVQAENVVPL